MKNKPAQDNPFIGKALPLEHCAEYDGAARHYAQHGRLPECMGSPGALDYIQADPESFETRVKQMRHSLSAEASNPAIDIDHGRRPDGSIWVSIPGPYKAHSQFDWPGTWLQLKGIIRALSTPEQARQQAQRQSEYVRALEEIVSVARVALSLGKFRSSQRADEVASHLSELLTNLDAKQALAKLQEVKGEK